MNADSFISITVNGDTAVLTIQGVIDQYEHSSSAVLRAAVGCCVRSDVRKLFMDMLRVPYLDEAVAKPFANALASTLSIGRNVQVEMKLMNVSPLIEGQIRRARPDVEFEII